MPNYCREQGAQGCRIWYRGRLRGHYRARPRSCRSYFEATCGNGCSDRQLDVDDLAVLRVCKQFVNGFTAPNVIVNTSRHGGRSDGVITVASGVRGALSWAVMHELGTSSAASQTNTTERPTARGSAASAASSAARRSPGTSWPSGGGSSPRRWPPMPGILGWMRFPPPGRWRAWPRSPPGGASRSLGSR